MTTKPIDLNKLRALCETMDIEPEQKRPVDFPFMRIDMGDGPDSMWWWYVTSTDGHKLIACQNEEHAQFVAAAIVAMPALLEIVDAALALGPELVYLKGPLSERLRDALAVVRR